MMSDAEADKWTELVKRMGERLAFLEQLHFILEAKARAQGTFITSQIDADIPAKTRAEANKRLTTLFKLHYDEVVNELETLLSPAAAARIDFRSTLPLHEQEEWYLAQFEKKPFSNTGLEPPSE